MISCHELKEPFNVLFTVESMLLRVRQKTHRSNVYRCITEEFYSYGGISVRLEQSQHICTEDRIALKVMYCICDSGAVKCHV